MPLPTDETAELTLLAAEENAEPTELQKPIITPFYFYKINF